MHGTLCHKIECLSVQIKSYVKCMGFTGNFSLTLSIDFGTYHIGAQGQVTLHSLTIVFATNLPNMLAVAG